MPPVILFQEKMLLVENAPLGPPKFMQARLECETWMSSKGLAAWMLLSPGPVRG